MLDVCATFAVLILATTASRSCVGEVSCWKGHACNLFCTRLAIYMSAIAFGSKTILVLIDRIREVIIKRNTTYSTENCASPSFLISGRDRCYQ
jgi:hypothetical protein